MPIVDTAWQVFGAAIVFLTGLAISIFLSRRFSVPWKRSVFLYAWHTAFCLAYMVYSLTTSADATTYYQESLAYSGGASSGTEFLYAFTSIFTRYLGLSYLGVFLVFNVLGFIGLLAFYGAVNEAVDHKSARLSRLGFLVVLLPSASFWSAALGKDAIAFMATCLFLWSILRLKGRILWLLVAITAMSLVRLHIAALMVTSIAIGAVVMPGLSRFARVALAVAGVLGVLIVVPAAMEYAGIGSGTRADIADYVQLRQSYNQDAGSGIDISGMSKPMQLATYLYRPFPFEAHNATSLAASLENVLILGLSFLALIGLVGSKGRSLALGQMTQWIYVISVWGVLAVTTANLGIAVRQKWMFLPVLFYLFLSILGRKSAQRRRVSSRSHNA